MSGGVAAIQMNINFQNEKGKNESIKYTIITPPSIHLSEEVIRGYLEKDPQSYAPTEDHAIVIDLDQIQQVRFLRFYYPYY